MYVQLEDAVLHLFINLFFVLDSTIWSFSSSIHKTSATCWKHNRFWTDALKTANFLNLPLVDFCFLPSKDDLEGFLYPEEINTASSD